MISILGSINSNIVSIEFNTTIVLCDKTFPTVYQFNSLSSSLQGTVGSLYVTLVVECHPGQVRLYLAALFWEMIRDQEK